MENNSCINEMKCLLTEALNPTFLTIEDQSDLHIGHGNAKEGQGHYSIEIVSMKFAGLTPVARHRLIYQCLLNLMTTRIHALRINAKTPDET